MGHVWQMSESKAQVKRNKKHPVSRPVVTNAEKRWLKERVELNTNAPNKIEYMIQKLNERWNVQIKSKGRCEHCISKAFYEDSGCVSDDELIELSAGRLRHV